MLIAVLFAFVVAGLATSITSPSDIVSLLVFPLVWALGLAVATAGRPPEERRALARLFALSFLLRVALSVALYRFGLVGVFGDDDSSGWYAGWGFARAWAGDPQFADVHPDFMDALRQVNQGYYYVAGAFLYLVGAPSRLSLAMLSALAGSLTVALVYRITRHLFGTDAAQRAGMWAAVFPSLVVWSAQTLKEPFILLCECAVLYAVIMLRSRPSARLTMFLFLSIFVLYTMRFYAAYLSAAAAVLALMWPAGARRAGTGLAGAVVLSAAVAGLFASGLWHVETQRLSLFNLQWVQQFRTDVATGEGSGSGVQLPYNVSTPGGALLAMPASLASFLLSPYPWQVPGGSLRLKLSFLDVLLWYWMIPRIVAGLREAWRTRPQAVGSAMFFVGPLSIFYALIFGNAGLAFRERAQILVPLLVFAGLGLTLRKPAADAQRGGSTAVSRSWAAGPAGVDAGEGA